MGRPEKPLDPAAGAVRRFADELRALRRAAGGPTYRSMAGQGPYSAPTLSSAAAGARLPTLPVALAYAAACGGDPAHWERRWNAARTALDAETTEAAEAAGGSGDDGTDGPYPGLARIESGAPFHGRDELTAALTGLLAGRRFAALVGASGSGKSSLLRAGLVPALRTRTAPDDRTRTATDDPAPAVIRILTPGEHPAATHGKLFLPPAVEGDAVVVVDQFEEVFTLCHDAAERAEFIDLLLTARDAGSRLRVVVAVRADFYGRCAEHPALADALRASTLLLGPMSPEQLREAIVGPAQARRLVVERALTARVVADVAGEPGGLPLMSHALLEVWRRRRGRTLTLAAYEAIGGMRGAVAHTAERVFTGFTPRQAETARRLLLRLISPGDGTQDTGRPVPLAELRESAAEDTAPVLERLVRARLLTAEADTVRLSHEALITGWPRLGAWIEEDREKLRLHRRIAEAARTWDELGRDDGALLRGSQLTSARETFVAAGTDGTHPTAPELTTLEGSFLAASLAAHDRARRTAVRTTRRLRGLTAGLSVLLCLAVVAGLLAWQQSRTAGRRAQEAEARRIAAVAEAVRGSDPRTALRLSVAAWRIADLPETREALYGASAQRELDVFPSPRAEFLPNEDNTVWRRVSSDGRTLTVLGPDRTERWDVATRRRLPAYPGLGAYADRVVEVSPDTRSAAVRTRQGVRLWDLAAGRPTGPAFRPFATAENPYTGDFEGGFAPDGRSLALQSTRHDTVQLWDLRTGRLLASLPSAGGSAHGLTVSPDRRLLAFCPDTGPLQVWDIRQHRALRTPWTAAPGLCDVDAFLFTPDSRALAFDLGTGVRAWDVRTGRERPRIPAAGVTESAFSQDGAYVATLTPDEVLVWRTADPSSPVFRRPAAGAGPHHLTLDVPRRVLRYEEGTEPALAIRSFSLDGALDGALGPGDPGGDAATTARYSPDGSTLATAHPGRRYEVRLRSTATGRPLATLPGPTCDDCDRVMAFGPDSRTFAYASGPSALTIHPAGRRLRVDDVIGIALDARSVTVARSSSTSSTLERRSLAPGSAAWSTLYRARDSSLVATAPDGRLLTDEGNLIDPSSGRARRVTRGESHAVAAAFSPDGRRLAMADQGGRVTLWDGDGRRRLAVLTPGVSGLARTSLAFSPDSRTVAVGGPDGSLRLWDTSSPGSGGAPLPPAEGPVLALAFTGHGPAGRLHVTTPRRTLRTYDLGLPHTAETVCTRAGGGLSPAAWRTYLPGLPFRTTC
ncbi:MULTISPECIES: hypothetical protein [unclassified Streptomyces]|uniref:nSTAND1 domain-containing NTPase n=1 Tax=unclassified Streptomyces TaxID=2593676 RepID=UPI0038249ACA